MKVRVSGVAPADRVRRCMGVLLLWMAPSVLIGAPPTVHFHFDSPSAFTVEWLAVEADGLRVLARSTRGEMRDVQLEAPAHADLARVLRAGDAPVTRPVPGSGDLQHGTEIPSHPGGELFIVLPESHVLPESVSLKRGNWTREIPVENSRYLEASGLEPGAYELAAVYSQDRPVPLHRAEVVDGKSTDIVPIALPPFGALDVRVNAGLCSLRRGLVVRISPSDVDDSSSPPTRVDLPSDCSSRVTGITPGSALVTLEDRGEHVYAAAEAEVRKGEWDRVSPLPVSVALTGRVLTSNGEAIDGASVTAISGPFHDRATTAGDGSYQIRLPATGDWSVRMRHQASGASWDRNLQLVPGVNRVDITVPVTTLQLTIRRNDGAPITQKVEVSIDGDNSPYPLSYTIAPERLPTVEIGGLKPDHYRLFVVSQGLYSPGELAFELGGRSLSAEVEAVLEKPPLTIYLTDSKGSPVRGQVQVGEALTYQQRQLGVFTLPEIAGGERLQVVPERGLAYCLTTPREGELRLVARQANQSLILLFPGRKDWPYVEIDGLPGSDCPVGLESLHAGSVEQSGSRGEIIRGLPAGRFTVITEDGQRIRVDVPGPPVTVLPGLGTSPAR